MRCSVWLMSGTCATFLLALSSGCNPMSAAMSGGRMLFNVAGEGSKLKVFLDNQEGKQNPLKKAWKGPKGTRFKVDDPVGTSPVFRYAIKDPEKFGRINTVMLAIHQEFKGDFSHLAEFVVHGRDSKAESQMKPDTDYDLGKLQENFKILDHRGDPVEKVKLAPGLKYRLVLTVVADRSETHIVDFETK